MGYKISLNPRTKQFVIFRINKGERARIVGSAKTKAEAEEKVKELE